MVEALSVEKRYRVGKGELWALDSVDLSLERGKTLALVGESGCGKSTLARLFSLLEEPTGGKILFEGRELNKLSRPELARFRRSVQMIFQDPYSSLNPRMRVGEIIGEPLDIHKLAAGNKRGERIAELLDLVGLPKEAAMRYPREFSGGQRQRISIARALAVEPEVIIADEPLSALDVSVQAQIITLLKKLQEERGLTYLFISHDLRVVEYLADEVAVMYLGELVERAGGEDLFSAPLHPYTSALIASSAKPDPGEPRGDGGVRGEAPSPLERPEGCFFHPRCPKAFDTCYHVRPEPLTLAGGRMVRCHLYSQG
ncbi:MAG: oligopeptide ABC transporter ATP-binding protein OppF [Deltaproteobacteria bacterium]|nr:MAG: oligopeptide ABC transporter ATP-binding protein OppF [Deltaproteobacteria bacterium]